MHRSKTGQANSAARRNWVSATNQLGGPVKHILVVWVGFAVLPSQAFGATFATAAGKAVIGGQECKDASVELTETTITVDCKKGGYASKLTELEELRWVVQGGWGTMVAKHAGSDFIIMVKKKEFGVLKAALLSNLESSAGSE